MGLHGLLQGYLYLYSEGIIHYPVWDLHQHFRERIEKNIKKNNTHDSLCLGEIRKTHLSASLEGYRYVSLLGGSS
jgi:hypothetical protein